MEELIEKKNSSSIDNENNVINIIKQISPLNIKDYSNEYLFSLIKSEKTFFDHISPDALKLFDKKLIQKLSKDNIKDFTKDNIEKFAKSEKIPFLNKEFLNFINKNIFPSLSDSFFSQINENQFISAKNKIIHNLIKIKKIHYFKKSVLKIFYKEYFNKVEDIKEILYLLSKAGEKFEYLTIDNFIYLENFIGKDERLDYFLDKLKKFRFIDEEEDINTSFHKGILNFKDIIDDSDIIIKNEEIKERIDYILIDGDYESYQFLKDYCIKCCEKDNNKEVMINILNDLLKKPSFTIFDKIRYFKILNILYFVDNIEENHQKYYPKLIKLLNEINYMKYQFKYPYEFDEQINFFSEIINEGKFDDDILEILAQENLGNIKNILQKFYTGTDKTAIPEYLRNLHIKAINDYLAVIKKKYKIQENLFIEKLKNISKDKEDFDIKMSIFLKSIDKNQRLYFDLLIQSVMEMPNLEKNVEAKANTLFKFIRDIGITYLAAKCASFTGSKTLTYLTYGIGFIKIMKNIKDEVVKYYFSLSDKQRKIYLKNQRNSPKKTTTIIADKIKNLYQKIVIPIKKNINYFIRNKILKIKDEKVGFNRLNLNFKDKENLKKLCEKYRDNDIEPYFINLNSKIGPNHFLLLNKLKEKLEKNYPKKKSKKEKLKKFFKVKQKMINHLIDQRKKKLNKEYPEFASTTLNTVKSYLYNIKDICIGTYNGFISAMSFNLIDIRIKKNNVQTIEELIRGLRYKEYNEKLKEFKDYEAECSKNTLRDDIQYLIKNTGDEHIINLLDDKIVTDKKHLEKLKDKFKTVSKEIENPPLKNNNNRENKIDDDEKNEMLIKIEEINEMQAKIDDAFEIIE